MGLTGFNPSANPLRETFEGLDRWQRIGVSAPVGQQERFTRVLQTSRLAAGLLFIFASLVLAVTWSWPEGYSVAVLAAVTATDAAIRLARNDSSQPTVSVFIDITVIYFGMHVAGVPDSALGLPLGYIILNAMLQLTARWALAASAYAGLWFVAIVRVLEGPTLSQTRAAVVGSIAGLLFVGAFLGVLMTLVKVMNRDRMRTVQRLRLQEALANASDMLLNDWDGRGLEQALSQLLEATDGASLFVSRNIQHPTLGLCADVISEVGQDPMSENETYVDWDPIPWAKKSGRAELESGRVFSITQEVMTDWETTTFRQRQIVSELNIPIFVEGKWWGVIGLTNAQERGVWSEADRSLLHAAGHMIGGFVTRRQAFERLEVLLASKDDFIASVSHELRTPLASVVGLSAELRDRGSDFRSEEQADLIRVIAEQANDVADIVADLLVAARMDNEDLAISMADVRVAAAVESIERSGLMEWFDEVDIDVHDLTVRADPGRVRQIIRNLVVNARRYGGSRIRIFAEQTDSSVKIVVADNGDGVAEELVDVIFERYERAHHSSTEPASVGLGLTVARRLARLMTGDLIYARNGDWTEFTLELPLPLTATRVEEGGAEIIQLPGTHASGA